jgi:hypothetical protein
VREELLRLLDDFETKAERAHQLGNEHIANSNYIAASHQDGKDEAFSYCIARLKELL